MSIKDIIKGSFIDQFSSDLSVKSIVLMLIVTALIGCYIFVVYRLTVRKAFYSKSFAISLVVIAMVTSLIILTVQSNIVISLGMVGALSIVRFRTAIKDPMDLAFLFWTISVGIICGAGIYEIAILGSLAITIVMMVLFMIPNIQPLKLIIVNANAEVNEEELLKVVKENTKSYVVRSKKNSSSGLDMIIEARGIKNDIEASKDIRAIDGVRQLTIMTHDGESTL